MPLGLVDQEGERDQPARASAAAPPLARRVEGVDVAPRPVAQQSEAAAGARALRQGRRLVAIVARAVVENAHRGIESHALADPDRQPVPVIALAIAQHADPGMRAHALAIAGGGVGIVPPPIVEHAEAVIVSRPLGEHVGLVAVVTGVIAEQSDPASERAAIAHADTLDITQRPPDRANGSAKPSAAR